MATKTIFTGKPVRIDGDWGVTIKLAAGDADPRPGDTVVTIPRNGDSFNQVIAQVVRQDGDNVTCTVDPKSRPQNRGTQAAQGNKAQGNKAQGNQSNRAKQQQARNGTCPTCGQQRTNNR